MNVEKYFNTIYFFRLNDIKQLIVNIKKDYKYLSRYIKDVKDYISLMEESLYILKH